MKFIFTLLLTVLISGKAQAHDYYFAFAEMEFNQSTSQYELTLRVSTHDMEHWLNDHQVTVKELEDHTKDSLIQYQISELLLEGFVVTANEDVVFHMDGYEVLETGMTNFYFTSEASELISPLHIMFNLMMEDYPLQQNKLTFIHDGMRVTVPFMALSDEHELIIENLK
jgi:hypothetical protein